MITEDLEGDEKKRGWLSEYFDMTTALRPTAPAQVQWDERAPAFIKKKGKGNKLNNTTSLFNYPREKQPENLSQALYSSCSKSDKKEKVKLISKREKTKREEGKNEIKYN